MAHANRKDINTALNGVSMEHRHFSYIAYILRLMPDGEAKDDTIVLFAKELKGTNPKFNTERFIAACRHGAV